MSGANRRTSATACFIVIFRAACGVALGTNTERLIFAPSATPQAAASLPRHDLDTETARHLHAPGAGLEAQLQLALAGGRAVVFGTNQERLAVADATDQGARLADARLPAAEADVLTHPFRPGHELAGVVRHHVHRAGGLHRNPIAIDLDPGVHPALLRHAAVLRRV